MMQRKGSWKRLGEEERRGEHQNAEDIKVRQ